MRQGGFSHRRGSLQADQLQIELLHQRQQCPGKMRIDVRLGNFLYMHLAGLKCDHQRRALQLCQYGGRVDMVTRFAIGPTDTVDHCAPRLRIEHRLKPRSLLT